MAQEAGLEGQAVLQGGPPWAWPWEGVVIGSVVIRGMAMGKCSYWRCGHGRVWSLGRGHQGHR